MGPLRPRGAGALRQPDLSLTLLADPAAGPAEGGRMTTPDYDTDFYAWTQAQAAAIRAGAWGDVDRNHLAEEIEDVGKSERRAVVNHLRVLLTHLLKWECQPEQRSDSWLHSMVNAQTELDTLLDENRGLRRELPDFVQRAYNQARRVAGLETGRPIASFPLNCHWDEETLLIPDVLLDKLRR
jgi:hypothetical protein